MIDEGRIISIESLLKHFDKRLTNLERCEQQPQPAPVTLVEVCEDYFDWIDTGCAYATDYKLQGYYNDKVRQALTVEHKRRVLVEIVLEALAVYRKCGYGWRNVGDALDALDAFDKERGV